MLKFGTNTHTQSFVWHNYVCFPPVWNLRAVTSKTVGGGGGGGGDGDDDVDRQQMEKFAHFAVQFQANLHFRFRSFLSRDAFIHRVFSSYTWCSFKAGSSYTWFSFKAGSSYTWFSFKAGSSYTWFSFKAGSSYTWCSFKAGSSYTWCSFKAGSSYSWCSFKTGLYGLMSNASLHCENSIVNKNTEEFSGGKWQNPSGVHVVVEVGKAAGYFNLSQSMPAFSRQGLHVTRGGLACA